MGLGVASREIRDFEMALEYFAGELLERALKRPPAACVLDEESPSPSRRY